MNLLSGVLVCCSLLVAAGSAAAEDRRPPVILIVGESLRADHLSSYGYARDTTDNIDGLADRSFLFSGAWSQAPCTNPAMPNILTSRYRAPMPLSEDHVTMAEYFKDLGYRTAAVVEKNPFLSPGRWKVEQGFDLYDYSPFPGPERPATDRAVAWIEENGEHPFFLWVFYYAPHRPYSPPGEFRGRYVKEELISRHTKDLLSRDEWARRAWRPIPLEQKQFLVDAYDEEVRYLDHEVGRLLDDLKKRGLFDRSLIVFTADHGEELGDNGGLWDHCSLLSREEIAVPLLLKLPGQEEGKRIDAPVQTIDIFPTLADIAGGGSLPGLTFQGKSLRPLLGDGPPETPSWAASFWKDQQSIAFDGLRYWKRGDEELLFDSRSGAIVDGAGTLREYRAMMETVAGGNDGGVFYDDVLANIRSLGYFK